MRYLSNAFSLQMQGEGTECITTEISVEDAKDQLNPIMSGDMERKSKYWGTGEVMFPAKSVIGHGDICTMINNELGLCGNTEYKPNRESVQLAVGDILLVGQYSGGRLPEGATELPEGAEVKWFRVECQKAGTAKKQALLAKTFRECASELAHSGGVVEYKKAAEESFPRLFDFI